MCFITYVEVNVWQQKHKDQKERIKVYYYKIITLYVKWYNITLR